MSHAYTVALRKAGQCLRNPVWKQCSHPSRLALSCQKPTLFHHNVSHNSITLPANLVKSSLASPSRSFSYYTRKAFNQSFAIQRLKAYNSQDDDEKGLAFQRGELTQEQLREVFGAVTPPPRFANRLLRILHGRRVDGTLDLPPPESMQGQLRRYPYASESALYWLRVNHPVDEDAAILSRIEREENEEEYESPAELQQSDSDIGLYGPQSGHYQAKLSEKEGDVFGESQIDKIRAQNIAEAEKEEEELQAQINKLQAEVKEQQSKALAQRPDQGIETAQEIRPPNEFEKWILRARNRSQSKLTLESPEVAGSSGLKRLLPSFVFMSLICAGSYFFAQYWVPPRRSERYFPDVSLSFATIATLVAANVAIYCAWSFPPFWRILNKFFIATPAYPKALSMLGNIFSHQSGKHLMYNMVGLMVFGLSLHEDVGRGVFMAIYLSSGVFGSFASLSNFALRKMFMTSSLGASGSIWGIMTAYCWLHKE